MLAFYLSLVESSSDKEKVETVYKKYYGLMKHVALGYSQSEADDIVHDAMVRIIKNIEKVDVSNERKTMAFCVTIVRNRAIDVLRKNGKVSEEFDGNIAAEGSFSPDFSKPEEIYQILLKALENLNETYKTVCTLKYVNDLSEREIAEILGLPEKTVNMRIFRGKQILKKALRKEDFYE